VRTSLWMAEGTGREDTDLQRFELPSLFTGIILRETNFDLQIQPQSKIEKIQKYSLTCFKIQPTDLTTVI
jgi:hypothetical protein